LIDEEYSLADINQENIVKGVKKEEVKVKVI